MVDKDHIQKLLDIHFRLSTKHYDILDDGGVEVDGDVTMIRPAGGRIPVSFNLIGGSFTATNMGLTSLKNSPPMCVGFYVNKNNLTSLEHAPDMVVIMNVSNNILTNLHHCPEVSDQLNVKNNPLESLEGLLPGLDEFEISVTWSPNLPLLRTLLASKIFVASPGSGYSRLNSKEPVNSILNKHAGTGKKGSLGAAVELAKAGFKDNARW